MRQDSLVLWLVLLLVPFPLAILVGFFTDYSDPANQGWLAMHPGYYYHANQGTGRGGTTVILFRGGGPGFGK